MRCRTLFSLQPLRRPSCLRIARHNFDKAELFKANPQPRSRSRLSALVPLVRLSTHTYTRINIYRYMSVYVNTHTYVQICECVCRHTRACDTLYPELSFRRVDEETVERTRRKDEYSHGVECIGNRKTRTTRRTVSSVPYTHIYTQLEKIRASLFL